jgi:hypothetical protein
MVDRHHSDNESVLFEEVEAGSMDEDEQCITAEGKEEEIFIVKMFNRHSNGEKEYNPPMKFHVGKATRLPKDKKTEEQWYQIQYEDNDTETMNEFELRQHKVTKRRADELRPTRDSTYKADGNRNLWLPVNVLSGGDSCAAIGDEPERPKFSGWSYVGLPPKHYPDQTGDATSCGPMTLMALNYEGDGLQPNFSKENCQEGGVFRPRITHGLIAAGTTPYGRHSAQGGD